VAWVVYVLVSKTQRRTYVGVTNDVEHRVLQHEGRLPGGASSTRAARPWSLGAMYGPFATRGAAQRAEARVKALTGRARLTWDGSLERLTTRDVARPARSSRK
jgi:predicted GIY-YIG superfamily endonuclease